MGMHGASQPKTTDSGLRRRCGEGRVDGPTPKADTNGTTPNGPVLPPLAVTLVDRLCMECLHGAAWHSTAKNGEFWPA
jgi:hypothetical protein